MKKAPALPDRILDAAEVVLRRHGSAKANVVDVARVLGMSHANIYRHFASKKALIDAVAERWLHTVTDPLEAIVNDPAQTAGERLEAWFHALRRFKRHKVRDDPELFRVYRRVTEHAHDIVEAHVGELHAQVERIIADGIARREFSPDREAGLTARAFLQATTRFHHPAMVLQDPLPTEAEARAVIGLLLAGLRSEAAPAPAAQKSRGRKVRRAA